MSCEVVLLEMLLCFMIRWQKNQIWLGLVTLHPDFRPLISRKIHTDNIISCGEDEVFLRLEVMVLCNRVES